MKKKMNSIYKNLSKWKYSAIVITLFFLFLLSSQPTHEYTDVDFENANAFESDDKFIVLKFTEKDLGSPVYNSGFKLLRDEMQTFSFDRNEGRFNVSFDSQLPNENTDIVMIYNYESNHGSSHSEINSIRNTPFLFYGQSGVSLEISFASENEELFLSIFNLDISLEEGENFSEYYLEKFQAKSIKLENVGVFSKDDFSITN